MLYFENVVNDQCDFIVTGDRNARVVKFHDFDEDDFLVRFAARVCSRYCMTAFIYRYGNKFTTVTFELTFANYKGKINYMLLTC